MASSCQLEEALRQVLEYMHNHRDEIRDFALNCIPIVGSVKQGFELYRLCNSEDATTAQIMIKVLSVGFSVAMDVFTVSKVVSACRAYSAAEKMLTEKVVQELGEEVAKSVAEEAFKKSSEEAMRATVYCGAKVIGNVGFKYVESKIEMEVEMMKEQNRQLQIQNDRLKEQSKQRKIENELLEKENRKRQIANEQQNRQLLIENDRVKILEEENRKRQIANDQQNRRLKIENDRVKTLEEENRQRQIANEQLVKQVEMLSRLQGAPSIQYSEDWFHKSFSSYQLLKVAHIGLYKLK